MALRSAREKRGETECGHVGQSSANRITRAPDLAPQRDRSLELDPDLGPRLRAPARLQHRAQDAVDTEPRMPEVGVSAMRVALAAYFFPNGSKANFWPPTLASNMRPPLPVVKTATPFSYLALADASFAAATALA